VLLLLLAIIAFLARESTPEPVAAPAAHDASV